MLIVNWKMACLKSLKAHEPMTMTYLITFIDSIFNPAKLLNSNTTTQTAVFQKIIFNFDDFLSTHNKHLFYQTSLASRDRFSYSQNNSHPVMRDVDH